MEIFFFILGTVASILWSQIYFKITRYFGSLDVDLYSYDKPAFLLNMVGNPKTLKNGSYITMKVVHKELKDTFESQE